MKIAILGDDSLASATAECCSRFFSVSRNSGYADCDVLWVCIDTPTKPSHEPDVQAVLAPTISAVEQAPKSALVLVSSQLPVGTTARLEDLFPDRAFAHSPENIRVATAVADFERQSRIVVGLRAKHADRKLLIAELLSPFTTRIVFTDPETAEMTKHALNVFLALQIAYINEVARVCAKVGADAVTVSQVLKLDERVSPKAPLRPGAPYGGGHLEREVVNLNRIGRELGLSLPLIENVERSNSS